MSQSEPAAGGIRVARRRGYTVVYNDMLPAEAAISARAWGLYVYLLSRPDGWECRVSHLQTVFKEGREAIYKALRELIPVGLMSIETFMVNGTPRRRYVLDDHAQPQVPEPDIPGDTDSRDTGFRDPENPRQVIKDLDPIQTTTKDLGVDSVSAPNEPIAKTVVDLMALAEKYARDWWAFYERQHKAPVAGSRSAHMSIRASIKKALDAGYTETEIKNALMDLDVAVPALQPWQQALERAKTGRRQSSNGVPKNVLPVVDDERREKLLEGWS